jgi:hypothetical protein
MPKEYYFIDIDLTTLQILNWGITPYATLTGETNDKNVHRVFLTKGQYHKFAKKITKKS